MTTESIPTLDERAEFEAAMRNRGRSDFRRTDALGCYVNVFTEGQWEGWQASAARIKSESSPISEAEQRAAQDDAYVQGRREEQQVLASVLPGVWYMDPPDGGAPTILEQLQRQAKDAARYVFLRDLMTRNLPETWQQVEQIAAIGCWDGGWPGFDDSVDAARVAATAGRPQA